MGDHHHGLPEFLTGDLHQAQNVLAGLGVEIAGWLVGQQDGGFGGERPGNGDPLLLPARQLAGQVLQLLFQAKRRHNFPDKGFVYCPPIQLDGQDDVLPYAEHRHQIVGLEYKADLPPPEDGQLLVLERKDILAVHGYFAGGGAVESAQHMQQGALARTRRAHDGYKFSLFHRKVHPIQGLDQGVAGAVVFFQAFRLQDAHTANLPIKIVCDVFSFPSQTIAQQSFEALSRI